MKYVMKVTGNYLTNDAVDERDAKKLALLHFRSELNRWFDGKAMAIEMFDIEVEIK